jgi:hypothetical protein
MAPFPGDEINARVTPCRGTTLIPQLHKALTDKFHSKVSLNVQHGAPIQGELLFRRHDPPETVVVDMPVDGKATKHDITAEMRPSVREHHACSHRDHRRAHFPVDPEYQDAVRRNIILAGGGQPDSRTGPVHRREIEPLRSVPKVKTVDEPVLFRSAWLHGTGQGENADRVLGRRTGTRRSSDLITFFVVCAH